MINGKKVLAFVPARGGSKRLPRKNVLPLCGKPLIGWSLDAAKESKYIDEICVSTDDIEIAKVSEDFNVPVPNLRPESLATDTARTDDVLLYSLKDQDSEIVVILQPTSPLRSAKHIDEALELFIRKKAFSIVSVTSCEQSPLWSNTLPDDGNLGGFISEEVLRGGHNISKYYRLNGAIYIFSVKKLIEAGKIIYTSTSYAYIMDNYCSIDIDNKIDFDFAEFFMRNNNE